METKPPLNLVTMVMSQFLASEVSCWGITGLDCFTVSLHSTNGRHWPAVRAVEGDCQWPLKNSANSHRSHDTTMHCSPTKFSADVESPNLYLTQAIMQPGLGQVPDLRVRVQVRVLVICVSPSPSTWLLHEYEYEYWLMSTSTSVSTGLWSTFYIACIGSRFLLFGP